MKLPQKIEEAVKYIKSQCQLTPEVGIVLGTGLGGLINSIEQEAVIEYSSIPYFEDPTVMEHEGRLIFGKISGRQVVCMQGRFHLYEGYSYEEVTFPIRVMKALGCEYLVVSNACGCVNTRLKAGQVMCITDHINLLGTNPLMGKNYEELGPRFTDMIEPYSQKMIDIVSEVALDEGISLQKGVYACMSGPSLETRAEYRMLQIIGADVIGMSTVPEVIVGVHSGLKILGLSVITDECFPEALKPISIPEIMENAMRAEPKMVQLIKGMLKKL